MLVTANARSKWGPDPSRIPRDGVHRRLPPHGMRRKLPGDCQEATERFPDKGNSVAHTTTRGLTYTSTFLDWSAPGNLGATVL